MVNKFKIIFVFVVFLVSIFCVGASDVVIKSEKIGLGIVPNAFIDVQGVDNSNVWFGRRSGGGLTHNAYIDSSGDGGLDIRNSSGIVRVNFNSDLTGNSYVLGDFGVGTNTPVGFTGYADTDFHVKGKSSDKGAEVTISDNSNSYWLGFFSGNSVSLPGFFWDDVSDLSWGTETSLGSNYTERMRLSNSGNLGINCQSPDHDLTIGGSGGGCNTGIYSELDAGEATFTTSSSTLLKENIAQLNTALALDKISQLIPVRYNFKTYTKTLINEMGEVNTEIIPKSKQIYGLTAENVHETFKNDPLYTGNNQSINWNYINMQILNSIKELKKQNDILITKNTELEQRITILENK